MTMYKWNVRTVRISHDYIEEIVEAKTAREAEAKIDPLKYDYDDEGWVLDDCPEIFISSDRTERMDKLLPDYYGNPDEENTLDIPEFAQGILYAWSKEIYVEVIATDEEDYWEVVHDVPMSAGKHPEYTSFDLNIYKGDGGEWCCVAYAIWYDEDNDQHTKTDEWLRIW